MTQRYSNVVIVLCLIICIGAAATPAINDDDLLAQLESVDEVVRLRAFSELVRRRDERADQLIAKAADINCPPSSRYWAVRLLGSIRSARAIRILVANLEWKHAESVNGVSFITPYPCANALAEIGQSAVPEIVMSLARERSNELTDEMIRVRVGLLVAIYHPDIAYGGRDEAIAVVERTRDRISPLANLRRANLDRLIDALKAFPGNGGAD